MKSSILISLIRSSFENRIMRPLLIQGSPGLGKTSLPRQAAEALGVPCHVIHAPLLQPEDYGFPVIGEDRKSVSFVVSEEVFPVVGSAFPERGILVIDELSQLDAPTQKVIGNILLERRIHGKEILPGWLIVATGNRSTDRAGANRLLSHVQDRLTPVSLEVSLDDWVSWALSASVAPEVIAFLRFRPDLLNSFDANREINATPRSWVLGVSARLGLIPREAQFEVFSGDVGEGPAAEFLSFVEMMRDLPSLDEILSSPSSAPVPSPDKANVLYATVTGLAARVTEKTFVSVMTYVKRLPAEFSVLFVRDALKRNPKIGETEAFVTWASGDGAKLLSGGI